MKSTCPGSGKSLITFSLSDAANSAASEVEIQSSASPHFSITALHYKLRQILSSLKIGGD